MPGILIIGFGNVLRGDDAVGFHAARELEQLFRDDPDVEVIATQQLTPDLADDISRSSFVVFIDASYNEEPGTIHRMPVAPEPGPGGFTHHLNPTSLLQAAEQLYGDVPDAASVTLTGWSFDLSNKLSRGAQLRLPELLRLVRELVASRRSQSPVRGEALRAP